MNCFKKRAGAAVFALALCAGTLPFGVMASPAQDNPAAVAEEMSDVAVTAAPQARASGIPVYYGGQEVCNGNAFLYQAQTYVPLRSFCTYVTGNNLSVTWNASTRTAGVRTATLTLSAKEGDRYLTANGRCFYTGGQILNRGGTLYVPVRALAKAFGLTVTWNTATCSVVLTGDAKTYVLPDATSTYDADALYWLSRIISAEAKGEPFTGQIAVGNVVQNRVRSREYPDSIWGVIFDRKYGTQFSPVASGTIYNAPTESAVAAAKICLEGYSLSSDILFFFNPAIATSSWISRTRPYAFTIGNHRFYR